MAIKNKFFNQALEKVKAHKKTAEEKKELKKLHVQRMAEMQRYVDCCEEKVTLFVKVLKETICKETNEAIIGKGVVVFVRLLDSLKVLEDKLTEEGIEFQTIQGKCTGKQRAKINEWFSENPENKVIFITTAGSASINLNQTNHLILYNVPTSMRQFIQVLGRIARSFGAFNEFNIHTICVEDTLDEYQQVLVSSRKEMQNELLHCDSIPMKETNVFNNTILKKIKDRLLWKNKKK